MTTAELAKDFTALCAAGNFNEAGEKYWSEDVASTEAFGEPATVHGLAAVRGKSAWWYGAHDIHSTEAHGPYVNGDQFAVRFVMDITVKESGARMKMDEVGVYTVKDGKITEERFFYGG